MIRSRSRGALFVAVLLMCSACTANDATNKQSIKAIAFQDDTEGLMLKIGIEERNLQGDTKLPPMLMFYVTNNHDVDIDMLIWNTALENPLSADIFAVQLNGEAMIYQGRKVKRGAPALKDFITISSGGGIEAVVDITAYYDMSRPGEYSISLEPMTIYSSIDLNEITQVQIKPATITLRIN